MRKELALQFQLARRTSTASLLQGGGARRAAGPVGNPSGRDRCPRAQREGIALAVCENNRSRYCVSAHNYMGEIQAKLDDAEVAADPFPGAQGRLP